MQNAECRIKNEERRPGFSILHSAFCVLHSTFNMTTLETRDRLAPGAASSSLVEWHYSPSLEATDHLKLRSRYNLFIGGEFVEPHSKRWFETINPATEETIAEIAEGDAQDVDRAVREAR